ncbi:MAG: four helix bundle protein [Ardenticatenaceae bacterium]|nr:four helix bundle protein [Ardenticatenaceae bacterium]
MGDLFENLEVLKRAENLSDLLWQKVYRWNYFAKDTVGKQLARAVDSVGANIAESFGRYHFGEKLQFLYYARGSLFETKYWLNRAQSRNLITEIEWATLLKELNDLLKQLNGFIAYIKQLKSNHKIHQ